MQTRPNIHRTPHNFVQGRQDYLSLDEKYRCLETQFAIFKRRTSKQFEDMKHLYVTETSKLCKVIKEQKQSLPTDLAFERPATERDYKEVSLSTLSRLLVTSFNVEKLAERLNHIAGRDQGAKQETEMAETNREKNHALAFVCKSLHKAPLTCRRPQQKPNGRQEENKPPTCMTQQKATKVLSNMRKQVRWMGNTRTTSRFGF